MVGIAVTTAVLNAVLDTGLYFWLGPIGIVVATVGVRWTMAGVYLVLLRKVVPQTIGQELAVPSGGALSDRAQPGEGRHRRA
jgi:peptidoglycan biosynthesis protein MviN/MurJ (putative lipid II flippase)